MEEASMPLVPIESFSHSWLSNCPSFKAFIDNHHQTYEDSASLIEKDPILPPSRRFFLKTSPESSFKFVSLSDENRSLVYADELFRDGYIVPYRSTAGTHEESEALDTKMTGKIETRGGRKASKWRLLKYLKFNCLTPFSRSRVYSDEPRILTEKMKRESMEEGSGRRRNEEC